MKRIALPISVALAGLLAIPAVQHHAPAPRPAVVAESISTPVVPADDGMRELRELRASRSRIVPVPKATATPKPKRVVHHVAPKKVTHHRRLVASAKIQPSAGCSNWRASLGTDEAWIYNRESGMDPTSVNSSSGAMGLGQLLRSTYRNLGFTPDFNPCHQRNAARAYMKERYGSWSNARAFWESHRWW